MDSIQDILKKKSIKGDHRNKHEFQAFGNRLADEFGEPDKRSLYIKLAKNEDRNLLEVAREFVMRSENATTRGKLFMWKLSELKREKKEAASKNNKNVETTD